VNGKIVFSGSYIQGDKKCLGQTIYAITLFKLKIMRTNKDEIIEN